MVLLVLANHEIAVLIMGPIFINMMYDGSRGERLPKRFLGNGNMLQDISGGHVCSWMFRLKSSSVSSCVDIAPFPIEMGFSFAGVVSMNKSHRLPLHDAFVVVTSRGEGSLLSTATGTDTRVLKMRRPLPLTLIAMPAYKAHGFSFDIS